MIAWMSAKCDPNEYGQIKVYKFPKERTIYGPMQIESRIDQDTEISQKLTLWGQVGSRVIRGNLMVIPVRDSLVYVEPIYLQATQSKLPELKRVIVAYGDKIVMSPTLDEAVQSVFDHTEVRQEPSSSLPKSNASNAEVSKGRLKALYHSFKSEKGINWDAFTELMKGIESYLK